MGKVNWDSYWRPRAELQHGRVGRTDADGIILTAKVRVFTNEDSLMHLVSAILVEIDERWAGQHQPYIKWDHQNA